MPSAATVRVARTAYKSKNGFYFYSKFQISRHVLMYHFLLPCVFCVFLSKIPESWSDLWSVWPRGPRVRPRPHRYIAPSLEHHPLDPARPTGLCEHNFPRLCTSRDFRANESVVKCEKGQKVKYKYGCQCPHVYLRSVRERLGWSTIRLVLHRICHPSLDRTSTGRPTTSSDRRGNRGNNTMLVLEMVSLTVLGLCIISYIYSNSMPYVYTSEWKKKAQTFGLNS